MASHLTLRYFSVEVFCDINTVIENSQSHGTHGHIGHGTTTAHRAKMCFVQLICERFAEVLCKMPTSVQTLTTQ